MATVQAYYAIKDAASKEEMRMWLKGVKSRIEAQVAGAAQSFKGVRIPAAPVGAEDEEEHSLCNLIERFSHEMFVKMLRKKREEDYEGWDVESISNIDDLWESLQEHVEKGSEPDNLVDIANFCVFIWNLRRKSG